MDEFKNTIKRILNEKDKLEQKINLVINELKEKIEIINNLKHQFLESLKMKVKFVQLILNNYEKKMEDFDINYFLINNLENQTKFNLIELNLNKNYSLDKNIESVINYLNENINSQLDIVNNKEIKNENKIPENILGNDPIDVDYENICQFS